MVSCRSSSDAVEHAPASSSSPVSAVETIHVLALSNRAFIVNRYEQFSMQRADEGSYWIFRVESAAEVLSGETSQSNHRYVSDSPLVTLFYSGTGTEKKS